jgi:trehalose 6-phosphate phosphatase
VLDLSRTALFADLDGTLAPLQATPDAVGPDAERRHLIDSLMTRLMGRFAVISGRAVADLDRVLEDRVTALAGVHGLQRRTAAGRMVVASPAPTLTQARDALDRFASGRPGVIVEDKRLAIALHYRNAPAEGTAARMFAKRLAMDLSLELQDGEMVVELKGRGPDKGQAIRAFMSEPPFAGFTPIFIGDDLTDESGFEAVQALGGFGVIVGDRRPTLARFAFADIASSNRWLAQALVA